MVDDLWEMVEKLLGINDVPIFDTIAWNKSERVMSFRYKGTDKWVLAYLTYDSAGKMDMKRNNASYPDSEILWTNDPSTLIEDYVSPTVNQLVVYGWIYNEAKKHLSEKNDPTHGG